MKYLIHVDGIRCSSCVQKLEKLSNYSNSVTCARVFFGESLVEVEAQEGTSPDTVISSIQSLGFRASVLADKAKTFELNKKSNRQFMSKIAVAAFSAGNLMLFSIPMYAGIEGIYKTAFAYLSFFIFLPIVFYCGLDFYKSAYASLKNRNLSVDLPITMALLAGFFLSTYNLLKGHLDFLYYDSTASFILLILASRYFLHRLQQNFVSTYSESDFKIEDQIQIAGTDIFRKKEDLAVGDIIELKKGQTLPIDAVLVSDISEWNTALITGEGEPRCIQKDGAVSSGGKLLSEAALLKVTKTYLESDVSVIQSQLKNLKNSKTPVLDITDSFSNYFIGTVFLIAGAHIAWNFQNDLFGSFQRALALLIVACPCALALGTPLAYVMGAYKAKASGILIFRKDIFDRVLSVKELFFDKTGTLTYGNLNVTKVDLYSDEFMNIVLNLEKQSTHPVALAIRKKYFSIFSDLSMSSLEKTGFGVYSEFKGHLYEFFKSSEDSELSSSVLFKDGKKIMEVFFEDSLREDTAQVLSVLKENFKKITLLTGDKNSRATSVAKVCHLDFVLAEQTPQMKLEVVNSHNPCMMVGDGVNDVMAIQAAHVGIAVQGSVQLSADHCDAYLLKKGISQVKKLIDISKSVRSTLYTNITISLVYNIVAGMLALMGYVNPLVAAILMPISSAFIFLNTVRGIR